MAKLGAIPVGVFGALDYEEAYEILLVMHLMFRLTLSIPFAGRASSGSVGGGAVATSDDLDFDEAECPSFPVTTGA